MDDKKSEGKKLKIKNFSKLKENIIPAEILLMFFPTTVATSTGIY